MAHQPTFGGIPAEARIGSGIDRRLVPDFVGVLDKSGAVAGYVSRDDLFPVAKLAVQGPRTPGEAVAAGADVDSLPVFDRGGRLVGHWIDGTGFVALANSVSGPT